MSEWPVEITNKYGDMVEVYPCDGELHMYRDKRGETTLLVFDLAGLATLRAALEAAEQEMS